MFHGKIHYKWPFSIAMLVYQRVPTISYISWKSHRIDPPDSAKKTSVKIAKIRLHGVEPSVDGRKHQLLPDVVALQDPKLGRFVDGDSTIPPWKMIFPVKGGKFIHCHLVDMAKRGQDGDESVDITQSDPVSIVFRAKPAGVKRLLNERNVTTKRI